MRITLFSRLMVFLPYRGAKTLIPSEMQVGGSACNDDTWQTVKGKKGWGGGGVVFVFSSSSD
jgi:hypothetical protein